MQPPTLIALDEEVKPKMLEMDCDVVIIGRVKGMCQVVIPKPQVSRIHATIERQDVYCYIQDANSSNGTFVNGLRIRERHLLKDQDELGFGPGPALLRFEDMETTAQVVPLLVYDPQKMKFFVNKKPIKLTPNQFRFFYHLYQHLGELCVHKECAEAVWEREYDPIHDKDGLHKLANEIRKKLGEAKHILHSQHGMGYIIELFD
jgi:DNA-binding response OmpR family regulator